MYDDVFRAMADGHRRQIVSALMREPMVAGQLAEMVRLAPNAVSFHLKWLKSAGLVSTRREGRFLRYEANRHVIADWQHHVRQTFEPVRAPADRVRPAILPPLPPVRAVAELKPETRDQIPTAPVQITEVSDKAAAPLASSWEATSQAAEPLPTELL